MANQIPSPSLTPPPTIPTSSNPQDEAQKAELLKIFHDLTTASPPYPPSLAAMSALTSALANTPKPPMTTSETLALITHLTAHLRCAIPNPTPLTAGTDLLQRFLLATLNNPTTAAPDTAFTTTLHCALHTATLLVERGLQLSSQIARSQHKALIPAHATLLTYAHSPAVEALLLAAARAQTPFRIISVLPPDNGTIAAAQTRHSARLVRSMGVPVALIPSTGVAKALATTLPATAAPGAARAPVFERRVSAVLLGADAVLASGGVMGPLGTLQVAALAAAGAGTGAATCAGCRRVDVFVVAETFRFVRVLPLGQGEGEGDLGFASAGARFDGDDDDAGKGERVDRAAEAAAAAFDITPPELITGIVTESGLLTPSAVCEEMIKTWF